MEPKNFSKQIIGIISVFSILLFPIYIILAFLFQSIPEYYYSWFLDSFIIADYSSIAFILFFVVFFIVFNYKEKIAKNFVFMLILASSGILLILLSVTWVVELYIILMILSGPFIGFSIPVMYEFISLNVYPQQEKKVNIIISGITLLGFVAFSYFLFMIFGLIYWRFIYAITGSLIILASLYLAIIIKD